MTTKDGIKHKPKKEFEDIDKHWYVTKKIESVCGLKKKLSELIDDSEATMECWKCGRVGE